MTAFTPKMAGGNSDLRLRCPATWACSGEQIWHDSITTLSQTRRGVCPDFHDVHHDAPLPEKAHRVV